MRNVIKSVLIVMLIVVSVQRMENVLNVVLILPMIQETKYVKQ